MPRILELKIINDELWCRVGKPGDFENGVSLCTQKEVEEKYQEGYKDAMRGDWQLIYSADKDSHKAICVSDGKGMEPCHYRHGKWLNCYTGEPTTMDVTIWTYLPTIPTEEKPNDNY